MKIICIGRNYVDHAKELNNEVPKQPVFFMKPDSAILKGNKPFFLPDFSNQIEYEVELVVKINRLGKNIGKKFAHRYYNEIGLGIDFTARDLQHECKSKGLPWELAKTFDQSAVLSPFIPKEEFDDLNNIEFSLQKNGEQVQHAISNEMIFGIDELIAYVSQFVTLKIGDMIFTGTPAGVGRVDIGDRLTGFIAERKMFDFEVR
ncbi:FAA hydrolase family protein [Prolixibacteraceae bacterium JC049]|nr:FAA hydrolase family protein [Prolixibacteraceae bacterium JC049]